MRRLVFRSLAPLQHHGAAFPCLTSVDWSEFGDRTFCLVHASAPPGLIECGLITRIRRALASFTVRSVRISSRPTVCVVVRPIYKESICLYPILHLFFIFISSCGARWWLRPPTILGQTHANEILDDIDVC